MSVNTESSTSNADIFAEYDFLRSYNITGTLVTITRKFKPINERGEIIDDDY